jgi:hypothetical protein
VLKKQLRVVKKATLFCCNFVIITLKNILMNPILRLLIFCFVCNTQLFAQQDTSEWQVKPSVTLSGFVDIYYMYDFNQPTQTGRQPFLFNHNRHNEMNMNLGFIKLETSQSKYRSKLALQAGTYVNDNYADEPETYKSIFEANVGLSLNKKITFG